MRFQKAKIVENMRAKALSHNQCLEIGAGFDYQKYDAIIIENFPSDLPIVEIDGKYGLFDKTTGKEIVPVKYDEVIAYYSVDYWEKTTFIGCRVKLNGKWGYVNQTGKETVPVKYDSVKALRNGLIAVELDNKWGFFKETTGEEVTPLRFDDVSGLEINQCTSDWSEYEMHAVKLNGKWGFINIHGEVIIPPEYDEAVIYRTDTRTDAEPIYKLRVILKKDGQHYSINTNAFRSVKHVVELEYDKRYYSLYKEEEHWIEEDFEYGEPKTKEVLSIYLNK